MAVPARVAIQTFHQPTNQPTIAPKQALESKNHRFEGVFLESKKWSAHTLLSWTLSSPRPESTHASLYHCAPRGGAGS
jgi:hypothetical protein